MFPDTYTVGSRLIRLSQENVCQYEYRQHGSRHIGSITLTLAIIVFSIEKVSMCRVSADHMKSSRNAGHLMVEVREVDGEMFFKLAKSSGLTRMLCTDGSTLEKALTGLEVFQKITDLRDKKFRLNIGCKKNVTLSPTAKARKLTIEGTISSVHTPNIAGIDGQEINVVLDTQVHMCGLKLIVVPWNTFSRSSHRRGQMFGQMNSQSLGKSVDRQSIFLTLE